MKRISSVAVIIALFVLLAIGYTYDVDKKIFDLISRIDPREDASIPGATKIDDQAVFSGDEFQASEDDVKKYSLKHAPHFDVRIVNGVAVAIAEYVRLFRKQAGATANVKTTSRPDTIQTHEITFEVNVNLDTRKYTTLYSTIVGDWQSNMDRFVDTLRAIVRDLDIYVHPISSLAGTEPDEIKANNTLLATYQPRDWLTTIRLLEGKVNPTQYDPSLLYRVSEIYSWLSILKDWREDRSLSTLFATQAVSNYLLAAMLSRNPQGESNYHKGILLLALHQENASLTAFGQVNSGQRETARMLSAYIRGNFKHLIEESKQTETRGKVAQYLLARTYDKLAREREAESVLHRLLAVSPDFLEARLLLADLGSLGALRSTMDSILQDITQAHRYAANPDDPGSKPLASSILDKLTGEKMPWGLRFENYVDDHKALMAQIQGNRPQDKIVTGDFLRTFVSEEFLSASLLAYTMYGKRLGIFDKAEATANAIRDAYPRSDLARVLQIRLLKWKGRPGEARDYAKRIDVRTAGTFLLREILKTYGQWDDPELWPYVMSALSEYRKQETQGSHGIKRLSFYYYHSLHRQLGIDLLKRALAFTAYDYSIYKNLARYEKQETYFKGGETHIGHAYPFQLAAAAWYADRGDLPEAIAHYENAIKTSPETATAYLRLGHVYRRQGRVGQAIEVWNRYLRRGDTSLLAVNVKNQIGYTYLQEKQYDKAYEIFLDTHGSYQADALKGFAEANERVGRLDKAERYYLVGAKRYPSGIMPVELALYYLRQGSEERATAVLKEYASYNRPSYYFVEMIDYYRQIGKPQKIAPMLYAVNNDQPSSVLVFTLAHELSKKNLHDTAAPLNKELVKRGSYPWHNAVLFLDRKAKGGIANTEDLFWQAFSWLKGDQLIQQHFAFHLIRMGYYKEGFLAFERIEYTDEKDEAYAAVMMAIACKAGKLGEEYERKIDFEATNKVPWRRAAISYIFNELDEPTILAMADNDAKYVMVHTYIGLKKFIDKQTIDAAQHFRAGLGKGYPGVAEYNLAYTLLAKIEGKTEDWCCRSDID